MIQSLEITGPPSSQLNSPSGIKNQQQNNVSNEVTPSSGNTGIPGLP